MPCREVPLVLELQIFVTNEWNPKDGNHIEMGCHESEKKKKKNCYHHITSYSHVYHFLSGLAENIFRWPLGWHFCNFWHIFSSKKCGQILVSIVPSFACFVQTSREIILQGEQNRSWKVYNCIPRIVYQALISQKRVEFLKCRYHDQNLHFSIKTPKSFIFWDAKWTKFHPHQFFYQTFSVKNCIRCKIKCCLWNLFQ